MRFGCEAGACGGSEATPTARRRLRSTEGLASLVALEIVPPGPQFRVARAMTLAPRIDWVGGRLALDFESPPKRLAARSTLVIASTIQINLRIPRHLSHSIDTLQPQTQAPFLDHIPDNRLCPIKNVDRCPPASHARLQGTTTVTGMSTAVFRWR